MSWLQRYFKWKCHMQFNVVCINFATSDKHLTEFYDFVLQKVNELIRIIVIFMVSFSFDLSMFPRDRRGKRERAIEKKTVCMEKNRLRLMCLFDCTKTARLLAFSRLLKQIKWNKKKKEGKKKRLWWLLAQFRTVYLHGSLQSISVLFPKQVAIDDLKMSLKY